MKRRLFKLAIFLFLGTIVNVAVAWGCATWHGNNLPLVSLASDVFNAMGFETVRVEVNDVDCPKNSYISIELEEKGDGLSVISMETQSYASGEAWVRSWEDMPDSHLVAVMLIGTGIKQRLVFKDKVGRPMPMTHNRNGNSWMFFSGQLEWVDITVGLPLKSLFYTPSSSNLYSANKQAKVWRLPNVFGKLFPSTHELILPYGMLWLGIVINTVFYAVILWVLGSSPFAVWRFIRRKRGLCIKCGYDLRGMEHDVCPECGVDVDLK